MGNIFQKNPYPHQIWLVSWPIEIKISCNNNSIPFHRLQASLPKQPLLALMLPASIRSGWNNSCVIFYNLHHNYRQLLSSLSSSSSSLLWLLLNYNTGSIKYLFLFLGICFKKNCWIFSQISVFIFPYFILIPGLEYEFGLYV